MPQDKGSGSGWRVLGAGPFRVESERGEVIARFESHMVEEAQLLASAPDYREALRMIAEGPVNLADAKAIARRTLGM